MTILTSQEEIYTLKIRHKTPVEADFLTTIRVQELEELNFAGVSNCELCDLTLPQLQATKMELIAVDVTRNGEAQLFHEWSREERDIEYLRLTFGNTYRESPSEVLTDLVAAAQAPVIVEQHQDWCQSSPGRRSASRCFHFERRWGYADC